MYSLFGYGGDATSPTSDPYSTPLSTSTSYSFNSTVSTAPTTPALDSPNVTETGFKPKYASPPRVKKPYRRSEALADIAGVSYALELFLGSKMLEAEEYCHKSDEDKERLYFATGYGLIQCVKGLMSYEDEDLLAAIGHIKRGNDIASIHRKKQAFFGSRLAGYVVSTLHPSSVSFITSMTDVERHAELVYAESLYEKALLGIVYSGDWLAFIKEALNMRTTISIYNNLYAYITHQDSLAPSSIDTSIDSHFRSGVYLGVGMCNIILSMMPGKLMTLVELFGYHGDRALGLRLLEKAGGWDNLDEDSSSDTGSPTTIDGATPPVSPQESPSLPPQERGPISPQEEGVRRSICDMCLLLFHLVLSSFTFDGVDVALARRVLEWNLKRYPNGVFFLFGAGRLALIRSQPDLAISYYTQAMHAQKQYRNLHYISYWEMAISYLALWDVSGSLGCWRVLEAEGNWSKAIYSYGMAVCLLELAGQDEEKKKEAAKLMERVPGLRQKIAGKSIPMEKFVARKARKFAAQNQRLCLPALELAYLFLGIAHAPRGVIVQKMIPEVEAQLRSLGDGKAGEMKEGGKEEKDVHTDYKSRGESGYWDDWCLTKFLEGVCFRYVAFPDPEAEVDDESSLIYNKEGSLVYNKEESANRAMQAFKAVFECGPKIELDHQLVYHAHYELGRLLACMGDKEAAKEQFELALSGKPLEISASGRKGKYSMEGALHMRTHAAMDNLY